MTAIAHSSFSLLQKATSRLIEKRINFGEGEFYVLADRIKLNQVILNLATNSITSIEQKDSQIDEFISINASRASKDELKVRNIKRGDFDLGIAVDPDVDRCVFINENGEPLGEEYTLAMAVKLVLSKKLGHVVKNMSSSRVIDDIAKYYNCLAYESAVGEINVANKMIELNAVIGGEGNGGVMLPDLHIGRDAPIAAVLALQLMAEIRGKTSE